MDNRETVDLIASGYEWLCPECQKYNTEDTINYGTDDLTCQHCGANFLKGDPIHVW